MRWILDAINVVENWWTRATEEKTSLILAEAPADDKKAARNEHLLSFKRAFLLIRFSRFFYEYFDSNGRYATWTERLFRSPLQ